MPTFSSHHSVSAFFLGLIVLVIPTGGLLGDGTTPTEPLAPMNITENEGPSGIAKVTASESSNLVVTTTNDDTSVSITATNPTIVEGGSAVIYSFTRTSSNGALTVNFQLDATSTATAGIDYTLTSSSAVNFTPGTGAGSIVIPDTQTEATITLAALTEIPNSAEPAETTQLSLTSGTGYRIGGQANATVTISANSSLVTDTTDNGPGSLRQAVANASSGDTVTFDPMFFGAPHTITLTSPVTISTSINVNGPGANLLSLNGNGVSRIFHVNVALLTVTLRGMSLINGHAIGGGGAILAPLNPGSILTLTGCTVSGSTATLSGGGVMAGGTLNIIDCTISGNTAEGGGMGGSTGGGIACHGTLNLINSTVTGNAVSSTFSLNGGGALIIGSGAIINSTITNNSVAGSVGAGGISVYSGSATVANSIIAGNLNNTIVPDVSGAIISSGHNLVGNSVAPNYPILQVLTPGVIAGKYAVGTANFGAPLTTSGVTGRLVLAIDSSTVGGTINDACSPLINAAEITGKIAVLDVGGCPITSKVKNAQTAGALAVIIVNNGPATPLGTGAPDPTITIPIVTISQIDGAALKAELVAGVVGSLKIGPVSFFNTLGDLTGTAEAPLDPSLGPLANNGGATQTKALLNGSPAIQAGSNALMGALMTDQRGPGFHRAVGTVDIGAYEVQTLMSIVEDAPSKREGNGAGTTPFTFTVSRVGDSSSEVTMNYSVVAGTGASPAGAEDFGGTMPMGTITIPAGQTSSVLTINVIKEAELEPDDTFTVVLSNPSSGAITGASAAATITNDDSRTIISSDVNPSVRGEMVTLVASVDATTDYAVGTITFTEGGTTIGTGTLVSGIATLMLDTLNVGTHNVTASFSGDSDFGPSTSTALVQVVIKAATTISLGSSSNPTEPGQSVTFTATTTAVAPGGGAPTGTVSFKDGGTSLGSASVNSSGVASLAVNVLANGSHMITAVYDGDDNFLTSTSAGITQLVGPKTIVVNSGDNQSTTVGQSFASPLSVIVKDAAGTLLSGVTVTFAVPAVGASGTFAGGSTVVMNADSQALGKAPSFKGGIILAGPPETGEGGGGGTGIGVVGQPSSGSGIATSPTFTANTTSGSYLVTATVPGGASPASFMLTNIPGEAKTFTVAAAANATAGLPFTADLTARDQFGNVVTGYIGTVHFSSTGAGIAEMLPADYTFTAADSGSHTFINGVTLVRAGAQTLSANDTDRLVVRGSAGVQVSAGAPYFISAVTDPQITALGTAFPNTLIANVCDAYRNRVPGASVTFTAPSSGASGGFGANTIKVGVTDNAGNADSGTVTANTTPGSYTVTATVPGVSASATFNLGNGTMNPTTLQIGTSGVLNRQSNLFELTVNVTNTTATALNGFRLNVDFSSYLAAYPSLKLMNASSTTQAPVAYVNYPYPVAVGATVPMHLTFYTNNRLFPNPFSPILSVTNLATSDTAQAEPAGVPVTRIVQLGSSILLEWSTTTEKWYRVSYSSVDMTHWYDSPTPLQASANKLQWIDNGAPFTISPPNSVPSRFYRVREITIP
jgi:hypothetical protein